MLDDNGSRTICVRSVNSARFGGCSVDLRPMGTGKLKDGGNIEKAPPLGRAKVQPKIIERGNELTEMSIAIYRPVILASVRRVREPQEKTSEEPFAICAVHAARQ